MPLRNPTYLDLELLQNVADYHQIGYPVDSDVSETEGVASDLSGKLSIKVAEAGGGTKRTNQTQTSYRVAANPLRVMSDVIDDCDRLGLLKRERAFSEFAKGDLVELEGTAELSAVSEIAGVLAAMGPAMAQGLEAANPSTPSLGGAVFGGSARNLFLYELTETGMDCRVFFEIDDEYMFRTASRDDIDGEIALFGTVDRMVADGAELPIDTLLFPGFTRVARRAILAKGLDQLLLPMAPLLGEERVKNLRVVGPAVVVRSVAIY